MNEEILPDIRNKLTAPKIALDKLVKGEQVSAKYLRLALKDMKAAIKLLNRSKAGIKKSEY